MHPTVKAFLTEHYKPSVHALYGLLGRDLGWEGFQGCNLAAADPCEAKEGSAVAAGATVSLGVSIGADGKPFNKPIKGGWEEPSSLLHSRQDSANTGLASENLSAPLSALSSRRTFRCHETSTNQVINDQMRGPVNSPHFNPPETGHLGSSQIGGSINNLPVADSSGEDDEQQCGTSGSDERRHVSIQVLPQRLVPSERSSVSKWSQSGRPSGEIAAAAGEKNTSPEGRGPQGAFNLSVSSASGGPRVVPT